jgi:hypothetical protein
MVQNSSREKDSNENNNGIIRRFCPKGLSIQQLRKHCKSLFIRHSEQRRACEPKRRIQMNSKYSLDSSSSPSLCSVGRQNDNIYKSRVIQCFLKEYVYLLSKYKYLILIPRGSREKNGIRGIHYVRDLSKERWKPLKRV